MASRQAEEAEKNDAGIDRLVHHATILEMSGSSVRAEQAKARSAAADHDVNI